MYYISNRVVNEHETEYTSMRVPESSLKCFGQFLGFNTCL